MPRVLLVTLVAAAAAAFATAQQPAAFAPRAFPTGVPAGVDSLGKLVHVVDQGTLHVFSACTRGWQSRAIGATATTHQTNDCLLVRDQGTWLALGASRGRFAPLAVSPSAVLVNALSRNNDSVLLVRDNNLLHAFSGFTGRWTTRTVGGAALVSVQRHVALLADGNLLAGYDAHTGQWHDLPNAGPATALSTDGVCGVATAAATVFGFSALRGSWTSAPLLPASTMVRDDDWAVFHDGVVALGYSGITGSFATFVPGPIVATRTEDLFGVFTAAGSVAAFSAVRGTWSAQPIGPLASLRTNVATALVADGPTCAAYSAPLGMWAPLAVDAANDGVAGAVAAVTDRTTGMPYLFSALSGAWQAAPADALPGMPRLATTAALLPTATGFRAFSARSGAFVPLAIAAGTPVSNESSAPVVVWDAQAVHAFDARTDRWLATPRSAAAGAPDVQIWRTTVLVLDGGEALGFGAQAGQWHRQPLAGPVLAFRANSEGASVTTPTQLLGLSALPLPATLSQFPEFRRVQAVGAPFQLHLRMLPGDVALVAHGAPAAAPLAIPGLGTLALDPATMVAVALAPELDADRGVFAAVVPADPALQGARVWLQALVAPAAGAAYLTEATEVWLG